jgi:protease-4
MMLRNANSLLGWPILVVAAALWMLPDSAHAAHKVLRVRLSGPVAEAPADGMQFLAALAGEKHKTLYEWLELINQAADSAEIAGMALIIEQPVMSLAQIEELSRALRAFRERGKPVYCYLDYAGNGTYALACAADHITLAEYSVLDINGFNAVMWYYKGLFDKLGIQPDMLHCGAYKSAVEPFTRTAPSPEAAENVNWLLDGLFDRWLDLLAAGRGLTAAELRAAVDQAPLLANQALKLRLVDEVSSFPAFKQRIRKEFGQDVEVLKKLETGKPKIDFGNPFWFVNLFQELLERVDEPAKPGVAVIYIEGTITMGRSEPDFLGSGTSAGCDTIRAAFEQARADDSIKAVVVRVNSPGGSALSSDIMWEAATRLKAEKPLVVSMGGVAGSGGYYVAIPGDLIFAEETTITGSIGVLGGKLVWQGLMEDKLGLTTTEFHRGRQAGLMSMNRPWTDQERAFMQSFLDDIYEQFKGRVLASRGDRLKGDLEDLAGGRVYTGRQALEKGLVDRIGGLSDAIAYVAQKAGLGAKYEVYLLPEPRDVFEQMIAELTGQDMEDEFEIALRWSAESQPLLHALLPLLRQLAPEHVGTILRDMRNLLIVQQERAGCFMPQVFLLR